MRAAREDGTGMVTNRAQEGVAADRGSGLQMVRELVSAFARDEPFFKSREFDELSTRVRFIDPLFGALGWDVADHAGRGARREVVLENRHRQSAEAAGLDEWDEDLPAEELAARNVNTSVPDYLFRLDMTPKFIAEAKRPAVSLRTKMPTFQAKSYAWTMRLPVAVLTDFEDLRVFDARWRPQYNQPDAAVLEGLDLHYSAYEQHWDRIWDLLSRESVLGGSLERLHRDRPARGAQPVDRAFLTELVNWRSQVAIDLRDRNPDLSGWELAEATQRILDRVVFIRVMEDRGILPEEILKRYARQSDAWHRLVPQLRRLDAVYNGQLFAEHFAERLDLSDGVFQRLVASLYPPFSAYRFDVVSPALLGSVYERFLGQDITIDDGAVVIEDKPEVRHAGGVYYTPRWVVDRIVADVIGPLVEGKTPRAVANVKILDMSCGSGAFLLGAFDYLVAWHERYYDANPGENPDGHFTTTTGQRRLTADLKAQILSNNLYGVDIDPQAVEVSQMSLYLAVLEHENDASLRAQRRLFEAAYLPRLDRNIRWGNSLLSSEDLPHALFENQEVARRINPFDWRDPNLGFEEVFVRRGGFDAVIGNPPYTRVQVLRRYRPDETNAYMAKYSSAAEGSFDIAFPFVERGLELLRSDGRLGFIISRQFAETDAGRPLRELLSAGNHVRQIIDFGSGLVFENASAYTLILVASRASGGSWQLTRVPPPPDAQTLDQAASEHSPLSARLPARILSEAPWTLDLPAEQALLERLAEAHRPLGDVCDDVVFQGVITGADYVFRLIDDGPDRETPGLRWVSRRDTGDKSLVEEELLRPVLSGRTDIHRFWAAEPSEVLLLPYTRPQRASHFRLMRRAELRQQFPNTWSWLSRHADELRARTGDWTDENWWAYSRRQNLELFDEAKVLVPYMVDELGAHLDTGRSYFVNVSTGGYGIPASVLEDPEYICALLNGHLLSWALRRRSRAFRGGWFAARKGNLVGLPIAEPNVATRAEVVRAYRRCTDAATYLANSQGRGTDLAERALSTAVGQFDLIVEDLYGLTADERALIRT